MNRKRLQAGLSPIELLAILAVVALIAGFFLPALSRPPRNSAPRIKCVNNLKNVGLAFRIFATDNNDEFPPAILATNFANLISLNALDVFRSLSNELSTPKILSCPTDKSRLKEDGTFSTFTAKDISYFASLSASETNPAAILAGDRNILSNGKPVTGLLALTTNVASSLSWSKEMHVEQGNVTMADGSVQQLNSARLQQMTRDQRIATNFLTFP